MEQWIYPSWRSLPLIPSNSALSELGRHGMTLGEVNEVLVAGYDCSESKRKTGVFEKCLRRKKELVKVVVAKSYNYSLKTECWVVTHVGVVSV